MRNEINLVRFSNKIPLSFSVIDFDHVFIHTHSDVQLIIVLSGTVEVTIEEEIYCANENDIFIINPMEKHQMKALNHATVLSVLIDPNGFGLEDELAENLNFNLNSMKTPDHPGYETIRYIVYSIIIYNTKDNVNSIYTNRAIAYSLFAQLMNNFKIDISESVKKNHSAISEITSFMNNHYQEGLTLHYLSEHFNYSNAYLSRLFRSSLSSSFQEYYDSLRISMSLNDLLFTDANIESIALKNGFTNARSYVRAFQSVYSLYPAEYRKTYREANKESSENQNILKKESLDRIIEYYNDYNNRKNTPDTINATEELINIDMNDSCVLTENAVGDVLPFGNIRYFPLKEVQKNLTEVLKDIYFRHILLTDIIENSPFSLFHKGENGTTVFNEIAADYLISSLKELNLRPYFRVNYSSETMSLEDLEEVLLQLSEFFCGKEKGMEDVMIAVDWKEDLSSVSEKQIHDFHDAILSYYEKLNKKNFPALLGAPVSYKKDILNHIGLPQFMESARKKKQKIDFFPIRFFHDSEAPFISKNREELKQFIVYLKENGLFAEHKMHFEEVSFTNRKNLLNDTLYKASYIVKNVMDNKKSIASFTSGCFSDFLVPESFEKRTFAGNDGLLTYDFIRKASYNAYVLLSRMPGGCIKKAKNYMICRKENCLFILINNYSHYSDLFADNEYYELTEENRYDCFPRSAKISFRFIFDHVIGSSAVVRKYYISKDSGSAYDLYNQMAEDGVSLNEEETEALKKLSEMKFSLSRIGSIAGERLEIDASLMPLEIQLIEITLDCKK